MNPAHCLKGFHPLFEEVSKREASFRLILFCVRNGPKALSEPNRKLTRCARGNRNIGVHCVILGRGQATTRGQEYFVALDICPRLSAGNANRDSIEKHRRKYVSSGIEEVCEGLVPRKMLSG